MNKTLLFSKDREYKLLPERVRYSRVLLIPIVRSGYVLVKAFPHYT